MARHCTIGAVILVVFVASIQHRLADARAAELPTKFTLETTNQSSDQKSPTKWEQGMVKKNNNDKLSFYYTYYYFFIIIIK